MPETTVDHLDFIRIRGLQSADTEVFQGAAGGGSSSVTPPGDGDTTEWVGIPEDVIELVEGYTTDLNEWMKGINESADRSLGHSRFASNIPYVPEVLAGVGAVVGTGGAALPAVATAMITQTIANLVGQAVHNYVKSKDPNSAENLFKKAFLYTENGDELKSILKKALLDAVDGRQESRAVELVEALKALQYNDEEVDFGPFRVHLRGKVLDY